MESRYHQYSLTSSPWLPSGPVEPEDPLLEDRVVAVPQRQREAERLLRRRRCRPARPRSTGRPGTGRGRAGSSPRPCRARCSPRGPCPRPARTGRVPRPARPRRRRRPRPGGPARRRCRLWWSWQAVWPGAVALRRENSQDCGGGHPACRSSSGPAPVVGWSRGPTGSGWSPTAVGGYAMGTRAAGCAPAATTGCWWWPAPRRRAATLGLVALDPVVTLPSGHRVELAAHEWAAGACRPAGHELLESLRPAPTACRGGAGGSATWCSSGSWRCATARPSLGVVHRLVAGGPVDPGPGRAVHLARRARRAARRDGDLQVARGRGRRGRRRTPTGWPGPASAPAGRVVPRACTPARRRPAACRPTRTCAASGAFTAELRAGRRWRSRAWAGDLATEPPPATAVVDAARASEPGRWSPQRRRRDGGGRPAGAGRRRVRRRPGRAGRGGRLPVVRRLVARHDDLLRGAVPGHRPRRRGPRAAARATRPRCPRACSPTPPTPAAPSTTPPTRRCGSCTPSTGTWPPPATPTSPPSCCRPLDGIVAAHLARHPLRHPGRPGRRAARPGRAGGSR